MRADIPNRRPAVMDESWQKNKVPINAPTMAPAMTLAIATTMAPAIALAMALAIAPTMTGTNAPMIMA